MANDARKKREEPVRRRWGKALVFVVLIAAALASPSEQIAANSAIFGRISGHVVDKATGKPIEGANVMLLRVVNRDNALDSPATFEGK